MEEKIELRPIGVIMTPFTELSNMPIQPSSAIGVKGTIVLHDEFLPGLLDLEGFSHIILIYHFHKVTNHSLRVIPFMDTMEHGIFATRSPKRPNKLGISTVRLLSVSNNTLEIEGVDVLNNTPLLDIKPFFPNFDNRENVRGGWLEEKGSQEIGKLRSDDRFIE